MERRDFIKVISGISLVSIGGYVLLPSFQEVAEGIIKDATSQLSIDEDQVYIFMRDAEKEKYWNQFSTVKKGFIRFNYLVENRLFSLPYSNKYQQYKNQIVGWFLLSTDYFTNKMNDQEKISYVSFYNPYKRACGIPFSNIYYN